MNLLVKGDRFPKLRLEDLDGEVGLERFWREGPVIVNFMRHFGCSFCREHLVRLAAADDEIRAAGGRTVAIFQYDAEATTSYCESRGLPFDCLGDPRLEAYAEIGLGNGSIRQLFGWKVMRRGRQAYKANGLGGPQGGTSKLMPGTFVVDGEGRVELAHYSANAADNPEVDALIAAVGSAAASAE